MALLIFLVRIDLQGAPCKPYRVCICSGVLKTFSHLNRENSIKTALRMCILGTDRSINYTSVNWFWLNLPSFQYQIAKCFHIHISTFVIIEEITSAHLCIPSVWDSHNTSALSFTYNLAFLCLCVIIYFISIVCISLGSLAIQAWIKAVAFENNWVLWIFLAHFTIVFP